MDSTDRNKHFAPMQKGQPLKSVNGLDGTWLIQDLDSNVSNSENDMMESLPLPKVPILFKLSLRTPGFGFKVSSISKAEYMVLVPQTWEREETIAGVPYVSPESTSLDGHIAHFFYIRTIEDKIAFRDNLGNLTQIEEGVVARPT